MGVFHVTCVVDVLCLADNGHLGTCFRRPLLMLIAMHLMVVSSGPNRNVDLEGLLRSIVRLELLLHRYPIEWQIQINSIQSLSILFGIP